MRSDAGEVNGRAPWSPGRRAEVLGRWVSLGRAARMLDVSRRWVERFEAAGGFGAGNSAVLKRPGSERGDVRVRVRAVNAVMEGFAERRELDRQGMAGGAP